MCTVNIFTQLEKREASDVPGHIACSSREPNRIQINIKQEYGRVQRFGKVSNGLFKTAKNAQQPENVCIYFIYFTSF